MELNWYFLSKTLAEKAALQYGEKSGLHVVTVCPAVMFGPLLQSTVNGTSLFLLKTLRGEQETVENRGLVIADVRYVADALIIAYEKPDASASTLFIGVTFPFFGDLLGFFGGFAFAPSPFFIPSIIRLVIKKTKEV
ncbi:hypothetical protein ACLOJK_020604 [Asimina triloba]